MRGWKILATCFLGMSHLLSAADAFPGECLQFDGFNEYASLNSVNLFQTDYTIETWLRANGGGDEDGLFIATQGFNYGVVLSIWPDGRARYMHESPPSTHGPTGLQGGNNLRDGDWHHVAAVKDGSQLRLFVDGELVDAGSGAQNLGISLDMKIARYQPSGNGGNFPGLLEETRLWNRALDQSEIREQLHLTLAGTEPNLFAYWQMNESGGTNMLDQSGNGHDATLFNMAPSNWISSDAALGGGQSQSELVPAIGTVAFPLADLSLDVQTITNPNSLVVTRLDLAPPLSSPGDIDLDAQYWIVEAYGGGTLTADITFEPAETLPQSLEEYPADASLYRRAPLARSSWSASGSASSVDVTAGSILFEGQSNWGQFTLSRTERVPQIVSRTPADNALDRDPLQTLTFEFDLPIFAGSGALRILQEGGALIESIDATDTQISSNLVTLHLAQDLAFESSFYIEIDSDAFHDVDSVFFPGYSQPTDWDFNTIAMFTLAEDFSLTHTYILDMHWADADQDGDLDLLQAGRVFLGGGIWEYFLHLYSNAGDGNLGSPLVIAENDFRASNMLWEDIDGDGDLDILLGDTQGIPEASDRTHLFLREGSAYLEVDSGLPVFHSGDIAAADVDNDGDLDLYLAGKLNQAGDKITRLYLYDNGVFIDSGNELIELSDGSGSWADVDSDGDLDLLATGSSTIGYVTQLYENVAGNLFPVSSGLPHRSHGEATSWADYDDDGDPDLLFAAFQTLIGDNRLYRNEGGSFVETATSFPDVSSQATAWGDLDNDGDLDILFAGGLGVVLDPVTSVYLNDGAGLSVAPVSLPGVDLASLRLADIDNDGDLDLSLAGNAWDLDSNFVTINKVYLHNGSRVNSAPQAPGQPLVNIDGDRASFSWAASSDSESATSGLSYDIGCELLHNGRTVRPLPADPLSGFRRLVGHGNGGQGLSHTLVIPEVATPFPPNLDGRMVVNLQAIDHSWAGSAITSDTLQFFDTYFLGAFNPLVMGPSDELRWSSPAVALTESFQVQVSSDTSFTNPEMDQLLYQFHRYGSDRVALYEFHDYGQLQDDTEYFWRVRPHYLEPSWQTIHDPALRSFVYNPAGSPPLAPTAGFTPNSDDIVSDLFPRISWNAASDPDPDEHQEDLRYRVELDTTAAFSSTQFSEMTLPGITFVDVTPALLEGYRWFYRVRTIDPANLESDWSSTQSFLTLMPPQNLSIAVVEGGLDLDWDDLLLNDVLRSTPVYTVYSSLDPYAGFPQEWSVEAAQLSESEFTDPQGALDHKFYRITVGSGSTAPSAPKLDEQVQ